MRMPLLSATVLVLLVACNPTPPTPAVSETERALCDVWQDSLPTRSRADTAETIDAIGRAYDVFEATCQRPVFPK
jgi:hypothetical protein